jgi:hypothetical protein
MNQKVQLLLDNGLLTIEDLLEYAQQYMDGIDQYDDEQINKHTANQVFAVWYDNGLSYEEHNVSLCKLFASKDDASSFVAERTALLTNFTPDMTEEQYNAQDPDDIYCSYVQWVEDQRHMHAYFNQGQYFISEEDVS